MNELLTKLPDLKQNISLTKDTLHKCYKTLQTKTAEIHHDKSNVKCTPITFLDRYPSKLQIPFTEFVEPRIYNFLNKSNGFYQQYHIHIGKEISQFICIYHQRTLTLELRMWVTFSWSVFIRSTCGCDLLNRIFEIIVA